MYTFELYNIIELSLKWILHLPKIFSTYNYILLFENQ